MNSRKNGFQRPWSFKQIVAILIYLKFFFFHNILLIAKTPKQYHITGLIIFNLLFGLSFIFYVITSYINPGDPLLDKTRNIPDPENSYFMCSICNSSINLYSRHCVTCNKCIQEYDHHCKWVNNCIGKANYVFFLLLVGSTFSLTITAVITGSYAIAHTFNHQSHFNEGSARFLIS